MSPRFLLDGMLGSLARWLRICGYDAEYLRSAPDEELIRRAVESGRVLLTRDRMLYRKAIKAGAEAFMVEGESDAEKLASVSRRFSLKLDPERSRCPQCDAPLAAVGREAVRGRVPPRTFEAYDEFWVCGSCGKVYWRGSHWRSIVETVREASRRAEAADGPGHSL
ncbi:hypothetical protein DRO42_04930 [Candidatus Bathyarchaeota archaeon]|nr:MAG: hypothetical protein DRO42_04930 [Candidatus Bathyarchaeota archaeon]